MRDNHSTDSDDRAERANAYAALAGRLRKLGGECAYAQTKASLFAMALSYETLAARLSDSDGDS